MFFYYHVASDGTVTKAEPFEDEGAGHDTLVHYDEGEYFLENSLFVIKGEFFARVDENYKIMMLYIPNFVPTEEYLQDLYTHGLMNLFGDNSDDDQRDPMTQQQLADLQERLKNRYLFVVPMNICRLRNVPKDPQPPSAPASEVEGW